MGIGDMIAEKKEIYTSALVYGSTYSRDYDPNFLLKPKDFNMEDIKWARKFVLESVSYCDELEGIRHIIFGNEKYLVFGIAGILNDLLERNLSFEEKKSYQEYAFDGNGRNIKCFLGLVCHMEEKREGDSFQMDERKFIIPFIQEVARKDVWYSMEKIDRRSDYKYPLIIAGGRKDDSLKDHVIVSEKGKDEELFYQVLRMNAYGREPVSLCTNVYNLKMVEKKSFTYVSAGANTVRLYQKELGRPTDGTIAGMMKSGSQMCDEDKKNRNIVASIGIGFVTAGIIIALLVSLGQKKREDHKMTSVYDEFYRGEELESTNYTLKELFESQNQYAKLLRQYMPEIEYVQKCLKDLREEEKAFYEKELPEILAQLKNEDVSEASRKEWAEKLRDSMAKSFHMSKSLLDDLVIKQMDEFKQAAEEILRGGALV